MMEWIRKHDILTRVLSVLVAMMLWLYVVENNDEDTTKTYRDIGIQIQGLDTLRENGMTIIDGADTTVDVTVIGKWDALLNVRQDKFLITVDVSNITAPGVYELQYTVATNVDGARVADKNPRLITLTIDRIINKSVPVDLEVTGSVPDGYLLDDNYVVSPTAVEVQGPESQLQSIETAYATVDVSDLKQTSTMKVSYTLLDAQGQPVDMSRITVEEAAVSVTIQVHKAGVVPLVLDVTGIPGLPDSAVAYTIDPANVEIKGTPETLATINSINLGSVSLAALLAQGQTEVTLPIILPNGVTSENAPAEATVTFDFSHLEEKTLQIPVEQFTAVEGYEFVTQSLEVRLLGVEQAVSALTTQDVTVTFDPAELGELAEGEQATVSAVVTCGADDVVVLGKYELTVTPAVVEVVPEE